MKTERKKEEIKRENVLRARGEEMGTGENIGWERDGSKDCGHDWVKMLIWPDAGVSRYDLGLIVFSEFFMGWDGSLLFTIFHSFILLLCICLCTRFLGSLFTYSERLDYQPIPFAVIYSEMIVVVRNNT
jgi:hypothetical protein